MATVPTPAAVAKPTADVAKPTAVVAKAPAVVVKLSAVVAKSPAVVVKPPAIVAKPAAALAKPPAIVPKPAATTTQINTRSTRSSKPITTDDVATPNQKPKQKRVIKKHAPGVNPANVDYVELGKFYAAGGELPEAPIHPTYKPGGKLIENVRTSVTQECGIACASLQQHYLDNFKKPESNRVCGILVSFKPEHFLHEYVSEFHVNWEDLYLMLNLKAFDSSIMRCLSLYYYVKARDNGYKVAFIDPGNTAQWAIDDCERTVEDYIIHVMEMSKEDKDLILWPFHKKDH